MANVGTTLSSAWRAALVGAAALACLGAVAAGGVAQAAGDKVIVVAHADGTSSTAFGLRPHEGAKQKVAQTFVAPEDNVRLKSISTQLGGRDAVAIVKIYETGEQAPLGTLLETYRVPVTPDDSGDGWYPHTLKPALPMSTGHTYSFVLASKGDRLMSASGGYGRDEYTGGQPYCFCPTPFGYDENADGFLDNDFDHDNYSWSPMSVFGESPLNDFDFELRFRRSAP